MYNKNAAYDLLSFEKNKKKKNVVRLHGEKIRKRRQRAAKLALGIGIFAFCVCSASCMAVYINGQATITELTQKMSVVSKQLQESESRYTQLKMKKESTSPLNMVARVAKEELGMSSPENVQYINVVHADRAEIKPQRNIFNIIKDSFKN